MDRGTATSSDETGEQKALMWARGHGEGVRQQTIEPITGPTDAQAGIATPAGIWQAYKVHKTRSQIRQWTDRP